MIDQTISHYRILSKPGGGCMWVVYKAEDTSPRPIDRAEISSDDNADDTLALERFRRQVCVASG